MRRANIKRNTKKRGRPATGQDPVTTIRLAPDLVANIQKWGARHGVTSRSEALRQLVLLGLSTEPARRSKGTGTSDVRDARRSQSNQMAADAMDHEMRHSGASDDVKDARKRHLMKMPGQGSRKK